jgi:CBS domain-containing membrane protein
MLDQKLPRPPIFKPILAGATLHERLLACLGALVGIALSGLLSALVVGMDSHLPLLIAPVGASAVLLFAVPTSPLAQPWSIIGGNTLSALVGTIVVLIIPHPALAAGTAVALAIAVMSLTRSLHPPGGAAALTAVLGGSAVQSWGLFFPLVPMALNSCILVAVGLLFHRLARRKYPHRASAQVANKHGTADPPASIRVGFHEEDIDAALASLDETFDIDRDDLGRILREIELQTIIRGHTDLTCRDIMSRDVIMVAPDATREDACALLLRHNIRLLPVIDDEGHYLALSACGN